MSDGRRLNRQVQDRAIRFALRNPKIVLVLLGLAALAALAYVVWTNLPKRTSPPPVAGDGQPATIDPSRQFTDGR